MPVVSSSNRDSEHPNMQISEKKKMVTEISWQMADESDFPKHAGNYRFNNRLSFVELFYWDGLKIDD